MKKYYNKLVRDLVPEIIEKEGKKVNYRTLTPEELKDAALDKLLEEANELKKAKTNADRINEMADIVTVLTTIRTIFDIDIEEVYKVAGDKLFEKGGFRNGMFLESVEEE